MPSEGTTAECNAAGSVRLAAAGSKPVEELAGDEGKVNDTLGVEVLGDEEARGVDEGHQVDDEEALDEGRPIELTG